MNWFYKFMCRSRTIKLKADSGRVYVVKYHRSQFWTYETPSLKLFFEEKYAWWHGQVWKVYDGGGGCGFGTICTRAIFPRQKMKKFLKAEVERLERIFNKEN